MTRFFQQISRVARVTSALMLTGLCRLRQFQRPKRSISQRLSRSRQYSSFTQHDAVAVNERNVRVAPSPHRQRSGGALQYIPRKKRTNFGLNWGMVGFSLALVLLSHIGFTWFSESPVSAASSGIIQPPLSAQGSKIVDATGKSVLLRGVNWFGIETEMHAPHGLWKRDYKDMLGQLKSLGYNVIRLPYSVQSLRTSNLTGIDYSIGSNKDLQGKSPLEVMDYIIQEAGRQGLFILLDSHRLNDQRIPELWYGDGFTEADWIDTWKMLANRYKNQANVIGADLKNEPHGRASWGTNDQATDWRLAAERAGNAILEVNPNWLIVVEGVEKNVPGQKLANHWMGGNLEGAGRFPVRLSRSNKLVYSPHEYGPGVYNQPWFSESSFPNNLSSRWETGWNYIATQGIAPILIGEFGGRQVDTNSKEGIWQRQLVDFIRQKDMSFTYWSWNPNSGDTGGILLDDWQNVDAPKQQLLQTVLSANLFAQSSPDAPTFPPIASPSPSPSPQPIPSPSPSSSPQLSPSPSPSPSPQPNPNPGQSQLKVVSNMQSDWQSGFCVTMQVSNQGNASVGNWQVTFQMNQAAINNSWNATFKPQGSQYVATPLDWARVVEPGQSRELGFCANKLGSDYQPQQVSVSVITATSTPSSNQVAINSVTPSAAPVFPTPQQESDMSEPNLVSKPSVTASTTAQNLSKTVQSPKMASKQSPLKVTSNMQSDWQDGFCVTLQVANQGDTSVRDWQARFQMNQAAINNSWNGNFKSQGSEYVVTPPDWAQVIGPGQSQELGFCANKLGSDYQPRQVSVSMQ